MIHAKRSHENPLLIPDKSNEWESRAVFNGSVVDFEKIMVMAYRAESPKHMHFGKEVPLSTIGVASSSDGVHFHDRRQLILPEQDWERYGCEDPRVTKIDDKYVILYTGLADFPPKPDDIKICAAITDDFRTVLEKHQVTPFNAKAGALFPDKINGKIWMVLTANTDKPPSTIGFAELNSLEELWSKDFWNKWYGSLDDHGIELLRNENDHVEVGGVPVKTKYGWILIYAYIYNYKKPPATFAIEALLLDLENPKKIIGRTKRPIITPQEYYEQYGEVPNVIFPSGAYIDGDQLALYYGAADTSICRADVPLSELIETMKAPPKPIRPTKLTRFNHNPLIKPRQDHEWESLNTFNPAALFLNDKMHIFYRAQSEKGVSSVGYAISEDGYSITKRFDEPIYVPKEDFETKEGTGNSGAEDARVCVIGETLYMTYAAYDGHKPPRVALTSIAVNDFLDQKWNWEKPRLISPPGTMDKNCCILPEMINDHYIFFHRLDNEIWIDYKKSLDFREDEWIEGRVILRPRPESWDSYKIGICAAPIKTKHGWVMLYHGLSKFDGQYRVGAVLLDLFDLDNVIARLEEPILEPKEDYEQSGERPGTVFPCSAVLKDKTLFVYYGAGDHVMCGAAIEFNTLVDALIR